MFKAKNAGIAIANHNYDEYFQRRDRQILLKYVRRSEVHLVLLILSFGFLTITNCSPKSKPQAEIKPMNISLKVSKGRSTKKPSYIIKINNKDVSYNGIANMAVMGEKSYELSNKEYKEIYEVFSASEFQSFEENYIGRIRDLPIFTLGYNGRIVKYQKREAPKELMVLSQVIIDIFPKNNN